MSNGSAKLWTPERQAAEDAALEAEHSTQCAAGKHPFQARCDVTGEMFCSRCGAHWPCPGWWPSIWTRCPVHQP